MRFTQKLEAKVIQALRDHPEACITFDDTMYRPDGSIMVNRNNRQFRMHRYLAVALGVPLTRDTYLLPCTLNTRCMNPFHRTPSNHPGSGWPRRTCPNGHIYTDRMKTADGYRCAICHRDKLARRRVGSKRKGYCKNNHRLTKANSYLSQDKDGYTHRRCRKCTLERMRAQRAGGTNG